MNKALIDARLKQKSGKRMAKIGDRVTVTMPGPAVLWNAVTISGYQSIPADAPITIGGKIIREEGDNWIIELDMSLAGNSRLIIPKSIV